MWTTSHRYIVLAIAVGILIYLSIRLAIHRTYIPNPQPLEGSRAAELADRFDPNVATQAELAAIPGVGEKLAGVIVEYRTEYVKLHGGKLPFREAKDLLAIRGIGVAKMEAMEGYLVFPAKATSQPGKSLP